MVKCTYCQTFVSPGFGAALQQALLFKEFIIELFPTFGKPINPILIDFFSLWKLSNYLSKFINDPFPYGLVILAL